jgi:uncharacterized membrane-anchored protein YhcB (DUF1043 family)
MCLIRSEAAWFLAVAAFVMGVLFGVLAMAIVL